MAALASHPDARGGVARVAHGGGAAGADPVLAAVVALVLLKTGFFTLDMAANDVEVPMQDIGNALVGSEKYQYVLAFEFISVFLLACIIGGLVVSRKEEDK